MAACPRRRGKAFFDGANLVLSCRNAPCFMTAPSISRRSRQRQGVVIIRAKRAAALIPQNRRWAKRKLSAQNHLLRNVFFFPRPGQDFSWLFYCFLLFLDVNNPLCPIPIKGFFMRYKQYCSRKSRKGCFQSLFCLYV